MFGLFLFWISQFKDVFTKRLFFYKNFQGFKHCSIFHFQGSVCCLFSSATRSLYQSCLILSSTFLKSFSEAFSLRFSCCLTATLIVYHVVFALSTTFYPIFLAVLHCSRSGIYYTMPVKFCQALSFTFLFFCVRHKQ